VRWIALLLLVAACASSDVPERPDLEVTAYQEIGGKRIQYRLREGQVSDADVTVSAEHGELRDQIRSSNLRNVSVFWKDGDGLLKCKFPFGQEAEFDWIEGVPLSDVFAYTFFARSDISVTTRIGRGAPMVPRLLVRVTIPQKELPAELQWEGREAHHLVKESSLLLLELPRDEKNVLRTGDWNVALRTKTVTANFLIGIDPDGTPTASSGFVRRAQYTETYDSGSR